MAKFCWKCGSAVNEGVKFCRSCGAPLSQSVTSREPVQTNNQSPKQNKKKQKSTSDPVKKKKGKGIIVAAIVTAVVVTVGTGVAIIGIFGFREGGWFRKNSDSQERHRVVSEEQDEEVIKGPGRQDSSTYSGTNTAAMLEYAKRLEEMGNTEAAAEIYSKLPEAGRADMNEASQYYREDPRSLMLDALTGESLCEALDD